MDSLLKLWQQQLKSGRMEKFEVNDELISAAKRRHLQNISLVNGKFMILPIDQGLEHGPVDFLENPDAASPDFQLRLAKEAGFSAIALHIGLARKYWLATEFKNHVPLVLKLNGKTQVPNADAPFSRVDSTVAEAVEIGADAVGYTLYVGSARQDEDFEQFRQVRLDAARYDMPVIVWAYPRGKVITEDGGKASLAAVDYAVRVTMELGADMVKFNIPNFPDAGFKDDGRFAKYNNLRGLSKKQLIAKPLQTAGKLGTLLSGGDLKSKNEVLENVKIAMELGLDGIIFGRNIWKRPYPEALELSKKIRKIISSE